jgi:hypothetical protein
MDSTGHTVYYQRKHDAARRVEKRFGGAAFGVCLSAVVIAAHKFPFLYCRLSGRVHKTNDPEFRYEIRKHHIQNSRPCTFELLQGKGIKPAM